VFESAVLGVDELCQPNYSTDLQGVVKFGEDSRQRLPDHSRFTAANAALCTAAHMVTERSQGPTGCPVRPWEIGAADRIRTGDVQLGKLAFCH
jgi:hypothetical protein